MTTMGVRMCVSGVWPSSRSPAQPLTSANARVNVAFLVNTLETFYWYQHAADSCSPEMTVNVRLLRGDVVRAHAR